MRLVTFDDGSGPQAGVLVGGGDRAGLGALTRRRAPSGACSRPSTPTALADARRRAPAQAESASPLSRCDSSPRCPTPRRSSASASNYRDHAEETGQEIPTAPLWFAKFANSLIGSGEDIVLPAAHPDYVDYEAELAWSSGAPRTSVEEADALSTSPGRCPSTTSARATCSCRTRCGRAARRSTRSRPAAPRS